MHPPKNAQTSSHLPWFSRILQKVYQEFCKNRQTINTPNMPVGKFNWTLAHHEAFLTLKESIIQAPVLWYPNPNKQYIVYTDASDHACGAQLSQEPDGTEFPIAFLSHTFLETQKNGASQNKKLMELTMQSPSGIIISREQIL